MNELYNETIERRGKTYHYDPDYDCFYPQHHYDYDNGVFVQKYGWIIWTLILTALVFCVCVTTDPQLREWLYSLPQV